MSYYNSKFAVKRGRPMDPKVKEYLDTIKAMRPGLDSLFIKGARAADLQFLRKPVSRAGLAIQIQFVEMDETHKTSGVRVTRLAGRSDEI